MAKLQAIRGMNDILPEQSPTWRYLETCFARVVQSFGYREIRFPILEQTQLFKRSIGEITDIVEKEMYSFDDRNGDSLTLRPEGTAGCVRAADQHGLLYNQQQTQNFYKYYLPYLLHLQLNHIYLQNKYPQKNKLLYYSQLSMSMIQ